jgi:ComF family protein
MAGALVDRGLEGWAAGSVIVPVPTARARRAGRGYDQALLLARQVHKALKRAGVRPAGLSRAVKRVREGPPQTSLARKDRLRNPHGAFAAAGGPARTLRGRTAVLVDDVMTTGATIMACARALRESGATDVIALVAARTPPPGSAQLNPGDRDGKDERPGGDCEID